MSIQDKSLDSKIIEAARKEFYEKGYKDSTLRDIAKRAELTTGAIYNRYRNKEELFYSLCEPSIIAMNDFFRLTGEQRKIIPSIFFDLDIIKQSLSYHSKIVLANAEGLELLFFKSTGSKYQDYREDLLNTYLSEISKWFFILENKGVFTKNKVDDMVFKTLASLYIAHIEEILNHKDDIELVNIYIDKMAMVAFEIFNIILKE